MGDKTQSIRLSETQKKVLAGMRDNPNVTKPQLAAFAEVGKTTVDNCIKILKNIDLLSV